MSLASYHPTNGGWKKHSGNPVLGSHATGTCFDALVVPQDVGPRYKMYFSWRPKKSLAVCDSGDGVHWSEPRVILSPRPETGWEDDINRNAIVQKDGILHLWYTGQAVGKSCIGYAHAPDPRAIAPDPRAIAPDDGRYDFTRRAAPVLVPERTYEKMSVMNPCVLWDRGLFRMWYAAGETYEPNVICYAESADGIAWIKHSANPIFTKCEANPNERDRVGCCQVIRYCGGYLMFYIGYEDVDTARICAAWSPDGVTQWRRAQENPIVSPTENGWDGDACYKPSVVFDRENNRWLLWHNGRCGVEEYIGMAVHEGEELGI